MTTFSFELFPPKDAHADSPLPAGLADLVDTVDTIDGVDAAFFSVTYGAGGSTRQGSLDTADALTRGGHRVAGHLTCVDQSRDDVDAMISRYRELGVDHVVALRGDPSTGIDGAYHAPADGYASTAQLVDACKRHGVSEVSVAAYPEVHPQSPSLDHDLGLLAAKVDAGADRAITQMCLDTEAIVRYRDRVRAAGIDVRVTVGVLPIHSFPSVVRFAQRCGASIPPSLAERFRGLDDDPTTTEKLGAEYAAGQIRELAARGIDHIHLYTLNRAALTRAVIEQL